VRIRHQFEAHGSSSTVVCNLWPAKTVCCSYQDTCTWLKKPTEMHFWETGLKFPFGRNQKGKVFGILSQLKKLSNSNDGHAQNKTFLSSS